MTERAAAARRPASRPPRRRRGAAIRRLARDLVGLALLAAAGASGPGSRAVAASDAGGPPPSERPAAWEPAPPDADARAIALRAENTLRSRRTYLDARMVVESPRLPAPRVVEFRSWDDRPGKRSFIRIDAPAKDDGTTFLKLHPNLWMYVPRVERTVRIPPSMMLQSWMGSDFTNDDLVRESSEIDDYDHRLLGVDASLEQADGRRAWVLEYRPHEDAPVVWGRILAWIDVERGSPWQQEFFDEDGEKLRVLRFDDMREVDGRWVPHRWTLTPLEKPGHRTVIELETIHFDADFDEDVFTKRNLLRASERR